MNDFWNQRYSQPEYAYGVQPNKFFREQLKYKSGGPKEPEMLPTAEELKTVLSFMSNLKTWDETIVLTEGRYH